MAKEAGWFGPGSRIIITTQDRRLLRGHGVKHVYKVNLPTTKNALQIFCINAFGQNFPKDGFEKLAQEVTELAGELPLGLKVMGSHFRRMSKHEWTKELPRLRNTIDRDIESVLKFSYDALDDEDKALFLHIACLFNGEKMDQTLEEILGNKFLDVRQRVHILAEKSLISIHSEFLSMHNMLVQLGRQIVRRQSFDDPGQRKFLVDVKDICQVLTDDTGTRSVIGINLKLSEIEKELNISEEAFKGTCNLQFLRIYGIDYTGNRLHLPNGLNYLSRKLRLLHWEWYPMTFLSFEFHTEFLVKLCMPNSNLEKLWEGIKPLRSLKLMCLSFSKNLKELPDLSTAINLEKLDLIGCSSLLELPSSIGNAINLVELVLNRCSNLVELPSSIGNATSLQILDLGRCSKLAELPSSIGNVIHLKKLNLSECLNIKQLPSSMENLTNLQKLYLEYCTSLVELPKPVGKVTYLKELDRAIDSFLLKQPYSVNDVNRLERLHLRGCRSLTNTHAAIVRQCKNRVERVRMRDSPSRRRFRFLQYFITRTV